MDYETKEIIYYISCIMFIIIVIVGFLFCSDLADQYFTRRRIRIYCEELKKQDVDIDKLPLIIKF